MKITKNMIGRLVHLKTRGAISSYLILVIYSLFILSCSSDDVDTIPEWKVMPTEQKHISFIVGTDGKSLKNNTRSAIVQYYDDFLDKEIKVSCQKTSGTSYFSDEKITYTTNNDSWNMGHKYYWPYNTELDFFARAPFDDPNVSNITSAKSFTYTVPYYNSEQRDFMFAASYGANCGTDGSVPLNFLHGLSAISFKGKTSGNTVSVVVSGIELCNVYCQGIFEMPTTSTYGDTNGNLPSCSWTSLSSLGSLSAGVADGGVSLSALETVEISSSDGVITLIPQSLTAWDKTGKATDSGQTGSYLIIHCRLIDNGFYLAGSASTFGKIYVPFGNPDGFEQGKHYTYTLIFGVGYDEGGRANVIHLDMSSTITDWNREIINFDKNVL